MECGVVRSFVYFKMYARVSSMCIIMCLVAWLLFLIASRHFLLPSFLNYNLLGKWDDVAYNNWKFSSDLNAYMTTLNFSLTIINISSWYISIKYCSRLFNKNLTKQFAFELIINKIGNFTTCNQNYIKLGDLIMFQIGHENLGIKFQ